MKQPVFFSIIIPTFNRPTQLRSCLQSITRLDYAPDRFEVVVVDDGSNRPPESVVASLRKKLDITLVKRPHAGPAAARNAGAAKANGDFLAFTDDDCQPSPGWLKTLATTFASSPHCAAVGGRTINTLRQNLYSECSQLLINYLYSYYNETKNGLFFTSNNLAVSTNRFLAIGGFDTAFIRAGAEDREFCNRWLKHSYQMVYAPEALVYHCHPLDFGGFWRQHFNYGRGAFRFHQCRAAFGRKSLQLEPLAFYLNLVRCPFLVAREHRLLLSTLLVVAQAANAGGFFWEMASQVELRRHLPHARTKSQNGLSIKRKNTTEADDG